jgi:hypothetical protein
MAMRKTLLVLGVGLSFPVSAAMAQMPGMMGKAAQEHPAVQACKSDIARFCSNVPPGDGHIKQCMKAHLHELSEPCKEALFHAWLKE